MKAESYGAMEGVCTQINGCVALSGTDVHVSPRNYIDCDVDQLLFALSIEYGSVCMDSVSIIHNLV